VKCRDIAFVGGGIGSAIGNVHRISSQMDGNFQLVGGCFSRSPNANAETGSRWGLSETRIYRDLFELIDSERERVSTVAVLTPVFSHASIISVLLEEGFNVISEKPLVSSLDEARHLMAVAERSASQLYVTFNYTGYPMIRELRARILRGDFGQVRQMRLTMQQESYVKRDPEGNPIPPQVWRREDRSIPTVSLDLGMHVVHLQQFLLPQKPRSVTSRLASFGNFNDVVDDVDVMYACEEGLFVHGWWSKSAAGYTNGLSVELFGTEGSAKWVQLDPETLRLRGTGGSEQIIHRGTNDCIVAGLSRYNRFKAGHPDGFIEAFANTYADIAMRLDDPKKVETPFTYVDEFSVAQSAMLLATLDAAVEAARTRREVEITA